MKIKRPHIKLIGIQIKSLEIAKDMCASLDVIEEKCGIYSINITIKDPFVCPDIDLKELCETPMEMLIQKILKEIGECNAD